MVLDLFGIFKIFDIIRNLTIFHTHGHFTDFDASANCTVSVASSYV